MSRQIDLTQPISDDDRQWLEQKNDNWALDVNASYIADQPVDPANVPPAETEESEKSEETETSDESETAEETTEESEPEQKRTRRRKSE